MKKLILVSFLLIGFLSNAQTPALTWAKQIGGSGQDWANAVTTDTANNIYTTGFFQGSVDFDPNAGFYYLSSTGTQSMFITKYDNSGNLVWAKVMGGVSGTNCTGYAVVTDASGSIYLTGAFGGTIDFDPNSGVTNLTSAGSNDIFICKLDALGNLLWVNRIGSSNNDYGRTIALDSSNNVYIAGDFLGTVDFNPSAGTTNITSDTTWFDAYILKLDTDGNFIWVKQIGGISTESISGIDINGTNLFVSGYFVGTVDFNPNAGINNITAVGGGQDGFICKLDTSGNYVWAKNLGDSCISSKSDSLGNTFITGSFQGSSDFDPGATIVTLTSNGSLDLFIAKFDTLGNYIWAKNLGGSGLDQSAGMVLDNAFNIYLTGVFETTVDFDPNVGIANLVSKGNVDNFVAKYSPNGDYIWTGSIGSTQLDNGNSIALDSNNNVFAVGIFQQTADINPTPSVTNFISNGVYDAYVIKLESTTLARNKIQLSQNFKIYPNPSNGNFNIEINEELIGAKVSIYNILGQKVKDFTLDVTNTNQSLNNGVYLFEIEKDDNKTVKKLVVN
jgi:hypothetical protein